MIGPAAVHRWTILNNARVPDHALPGRRPRKLPGQGAIRLARDIASNVVCTGASRAGRRSVHANGRSIIGIDTTASDVSHHDALALIEETPYLHVVIEERSCRPPWRLTPSQRRYGSGYSPAWYRSRAPAPPAIAVSDRDRLPSHARYRGCDGAGEHLAPEHRRGDRHTGYRGANTDRRRRDNRAAICGGPGLRGEEGVPKEGVAVESDRASRQGRARHAIRGGRSRLRPTPSGLHEDRSHEVQPSLTSSRSNGEVGPAWSGRRPCWTVPVPARFSRRGRRPRRLFRVCRR